jgi:hypothetical protein
MFPAMEAEAMVFIDASVAIFFRGGWDAERSVLDFRLSEICREEYPQFQILTIPNFHLVEIEHKLQLQTMSHRWDHLAINNESHEYI